MASPSADQVPRTRLSSDTGGELPRNQWYYEYESNPRRRHRHRHQPATSGEAFDRHGFKFIGVGGSDVTVTWVSFLAILVTIDVVWFVHRMARTYSTAKMILYGWTTPTEGMYRTLHSTNKHCCVLSNSRLSNATSKRPKLAFFRGKICPPQSLNCQNRNSHTSKIVCLKL